MSPPPFKIHIAGSCPWCPRERPHDHDPAELVLARRGGRVVLPGPFSGSPEFVLPAQRAPACLGGAIRKYPISIMERFSRMIPSGGVVLRVGIDSRGEPSFWARIDPKAPLEPREFTLAGTGHPIPPGSGAFLGDFVLCGGRLTFFLFSGE